MNNIETYIQRDLHNIFKYYNISKLSDYQKRKLIFNYLCNNITYNWSLYAFILNDELYYKLKGTRLKTPRNNAKELQETIINHKGICNSISEYYKILLSRVGILSSVAIVDHGKITKHALNIVYDKNKDTYSLDDITSVITLHWSKKEAFNYTLEMAHKHNQGLKPLLKNHQSKWFIIPSTWIYYYINKEAPSNEINMDTFLGKELPNILNKKRKEKSLNISFPHI